MTAPFTFSRFTRIAVVPTVSDITAPTLTEIGAGFDIGQDVVLDGLDLGRVTESIDAGLWASELAATRHGRYSFSGASLTGRRYLQGGTETLWGLAAFGSRHFLVVRYGVPKATAWTAGQSVEVLDFRFGKRSVIASSGGPVLFTVPLNVTADADDAVVAT